MSLNAILAVIALPVVFVLGRYSSRYRFVRVRPRYRQNVKEFIRGK
ncbi:hypothetical protein [Effusibacillus dendaii]|uniref:Uncharacterized protein n=1 Tax=Effusibacillus dendaii TaxID=2743772 RepID=A0A7I8DAJ1_9BACL|nr:hypothetical protein [Effusibacillus dendaii]BCJ87115.1 hypothetical protein skT53_21000 [Effusibacillus dendaii]